MQERQKSKLNLIARLNIRNLLQLLGWDQYSQELQSKKLIQIKMQASIGNFLTKIRKELYNDHPELRNLHDDNMLFVVFDTVIPNVYI